MSRSKRQTRFWSKVSRVLLVAALAMGGAAACGDDDGGPTDTEDDGRY